MEIEGDSYFQNGLEWATILNNAYWDYFDKVTDSNLIESYAEDVPTSEVKRRIFTIFNWFTDLLLKTENDQSKVEIQFIKPNINLCTEWDPILHMFLLKCKTFSSYYL